MSELRLIETREMALDDIIVEDRLMRWACRRS
jgi:hypothetical protein